MAKAKSDVTAGAPAEAGEKQPVMYLVAYIFGWITGLIVLLTAGKTDAEAKFHAYQSIFVSVAAVLLEIVGFITIVGWLITIPVALLLWLYSIYVGYKAYSTGERVLIPYIGEYAVKYSEQ